MPTRDKWNQFKDLVRESPLSKTSIFVVTVLIAGLLINQLSDEIKDEQGQTHWEKIPYTKSFVGLSGVTGAVLVCYVAFREPSSKRVDEAYLKRFYSSTYPELEELAREAIRRGDFQELARLEEIIRRMDSNLEQ